MIPDFQTIMLPLLRILSDQKEHTLRDVIDEISNKFNLTEDERIQLLPSGNQAIINNRVGWARTYLKKANLLVTPRRGLLRISENGIKVLSSESTRIDVKFLRGLPEFQQWQLSYASKDGVSVIDDKTEVEAKNTPEELLDYSFLKLKEELIVEIIERVKEGTASSFEVLVIDLLIKMGYGGSKKEAGQVIGKVGDGGIDGVIKEDKLGLDTIFIQAKKYASTVPINHVRDFAGSLLAQKARKGIFITTSDYPQSAYQYVSNIEHRIRLINGRELAELMIEYNVGVATKSIYEIKRIDTDYFDN